MPRFIAPHKSGVHRIAAISLYRALLTGCRKACLPLEHHQDLQNAIRNRFRYNRFEQSKLVLSLAFNAGYEAVDLLGKAQGSPASKERVIELVDATPAKFKAPPVAPTPPTPLRPKHPVLNPNSDLILSRPRPHVSGRRRIPVLVSAGGVPFLRTNKPQPHHLSAYFRHKTSKRLTRHLQRQQLRETSVLGLLEDQWDSLIDKMVEEQGSDQAKEACPPTGGSWEYAISKAIQYLTWHVTSEIRNGRELAQKMEEVIRREKALAKQEKEARVQARLLERQRAGTFRLQLRLPDE